MPLSNEFIFRDVFQEIKKVDPKRRAAAIKGWQTRRRRRGVHTGDVIGNDTHGSPVRAFVLSDFPSTRSKPAKKTAKKRLTNVNTKSSTSRAAIKYRERRGLSMTPKQQRASAAIMDAEDRKKSG